VLSLGPLAFLTPWLLAALVVLPVLWWLLKVMPPSPRLIPFPAIRLLFGLERTEETPHRTPWWLLLLRLLIAALAILGLAHPLLNPGQPLQGSGPLLAVVDDGWAAARTWTQRTRALAELIDQAERADKAVMLLTTAAPATGEPLVPSRLMRAADARTLAQALTPKPWPSDRAAVRDALDGVALDGAVNAVWLSDGIDDGAAQALAERLQRLGRLRVLAPDPGERARVMLPPDATGAAFTVRARRADTGTEALASVAALSDDGRLLARPQLRFAAGEADASVALDLPLELRNELARLELEDETTAGAVVLLDERFRRRPVGLVSGDTLEVAQPLLGDLYYLERALEPFAEVRSGSIDDLLGRDLAVLVLADIGTLTESETAVLDDWVGRGGVLLRFAGPRLAEGDGDALLPVAVRRGGRAFGGAMQWAQPVGLAPFEPGSPFAGLIVPGDVTVSQQVLAEPAPDLGRKVWARLADGTPLVTADRRGAGWLILVHTTANTTWSSLALSGLYVDMMQRVVALSQGVAGEDAAAALPPFAALDGFGVLGAPPAVATAIAGDAFDAAGVGPRTPPGFYGTELTRRAHNLGAAVLAGTVAYGPLAELPSGIALEAYGTSRQLDLKPWVLLAALLLLLFDFVLALALRGLLPGVGAPAAHGTAAALVVAVGVALVPDGARAQADDEFALTATLETRFAYVQTGDRPLDEISRDGLTGLSAVLRGRTSVEPGDPIGVDLERDELAFFALIYWPMSELQLTLSDDALKRVNDFLRRGGTILFDTRDQQFAVGASGPGGETLRRLVGRLDLPALVPVPPDHVLTKAFYLMQDFPGRYAGGTLWVQQPDSRVNDGVSPVLVGGNDWAAAWALDDLGQPRFPVVPGGERQREMAFRFGVNLVMYALTGNYKADQVHVPAILERLGQ